MVVYSVFPFIFRSQYYVVTVTLNFYATVLQNLKYIMSFIGAEMVGGGISWGRVCGRRSCLLGVRCQVTPLSILPISRDVTIHRTIDII